MLDNLNVKQKKALIIISAIIVITLGIFYYKKTNNIDDMNLNEDILVEDNTIEKNEEKADNFIIVHITGAVKIPGIVKLPEGSRMEDAVQAAGGLTEDADISNVNLAYILDDGIKIKIPSNTDMEEKMNKNIIIEENEENIIENEQVQNTSAINGININKAQEKELTTLPGIGTSLASKIIQYRNENGKFNKKEEIKNVNGVGEKKYEDIKDLIYVK